MHRMIRYFPPKTLVTALAAALLAGCAVGPDYLRPDANLPAAYTAGGEAAAAQVQKDWWRLFNDASLNDLVTRALIANTDLMIAVARVAGKDAQIVMAVGIAGP